MGKIKLIFYKNSISENMLLPHEKFLKRKLKQGLTKKMNEWNKKTEKRGIVFISYVLPLMSANALREYCQPFGKITKIYLVPENELITRKRLKFTKDKRKRFIKGWIEFSDKVQGKEFVKMCNGQLMKGKRGSKFYHDIWNLKYLKNFKWSQLKQKISLNKAIHKSKLTFELNLAKRENQFIESNIGKKNHLIKKMLKFGKNIIDLPQKKKHDQVRSLLT